MLNSTSYFTRLTAHTPAHIDLYLFQDFTSSGRNGVDILTTSFFWRIILLLHGVRLE
jgi:hypothetical protein